MARLQAGIGLCLLCFFVLTSAAFTKENILGTVRLRENRLIFQSPSTATKANRYVTVDCPSGFLEKPAPTTNVIQPLATARFGETLTIVEISECKYTNGEHFAGHFVQVRTSQGIIGFTQLPNYHNV